MCDIPILCRGGGSSQKKLNTCNMNIKAVNKFQYTGKNDSVECPYIATCRQVLTTKIQVMQ